ncbi:hypothetical protein AgCh_006227 [Apium graveolens]
MNRTKLPIRERIGNVPQLPIGIDVAVAEVACEVTVKKFDEKKNRNTPFCLKCQKDLNKVDGVFNCCGKTIPNPDISDQMGAIPIVWPDDEITCITGKIVMMLMQHTCRRRPVNLDKANSKLAAGSSNPSDFVSRNMNPNITNQRRPSQSMFNSLNFKDASFLNGRLQNPATPSQRRLNNVNLSGVTYQSPISRVVQGSSTNQNPRIPFQLPASKISPTKTNQTNAHVVLAVKYQWATDCIDVHIIVPMDKFTAPFDGIEISGMRKRSQRKRIQRKRSQISHRPEPESKPLFEGRGRSSLL